MRRPLGGSFRRALGLILGVVLVLGLVLGTSGTAYAEAPTTDGGGIDLGGDGLSAAAVPTVTISIIPEGAGTAVAVQHLEQDSICRLVATPATGYAFKEWTYKVGNSTQSHTNNPYPVSKSDLSDGIITELTAVFEPRASSATNVTGVTLDKASATLVVGATERLTATVSPDDAPNKTVAWESDDTGVATVSDTGVVTAIAPGSATITATSNADNTKSATCVVTVGPVTHTVTKATLTFDLAGGTLDGKTGKLAVEANVGDTIKLPAAPTRDGYVFRCWKGSEYAAGANYEVEGDHEFAADWKAKDYPKPTMGNSKGGSFASTSDEITYTVSQEVPEWASSLRTWVDLESVLQYTSDAGAISVKTTDGTTVDAEVAIDDQRLTVTVADATALRGKTFTFSYKAKVRSGASLDAYLNDAKDTASVPYQAHTVFDSEDKNAVESAKESVKFKVGTSTTTKTTAATKASTLAKTGDATTVAAALAMAFVGMATVAAGWHRRR